MAIEKISTALAVGSIGSNGLIKMAAHFKLETGHLLLGGQSLKSEVK